MYMEFLSFLPNKFNCPVCEKEFFDEKEYYLNRCNNKRNGSIRVTCECKTCFHLSIDYTGKFHSYILNKTTHPQLPPTITISENISD